MAKTKYQETATEFARDYLEQLLKMEDILGRDLDNSVEHSLKQYRGKSSKKNIS
jgi:hypothetical protein